MAQRRYGPTQAAGVAVIELDGDKILEVAPLGVTGYVGVLERGPTDKLISTFNKTGLTKKTGGIIADSLLPDCAQDFWAHSNGAGELHLVRVTDGTERAAERTFYSRDTTSRIQCLKVQAKNGGRWGGKFGVFAGLFTSSGDLTATTLATTKTVKVDEWKGGTLNLYGASKTYTIVGNSAAGLVTVSSDATMAVDFGVSTNYNYTIELPRDTTKEVAVTFDDAEVVDAAQPALFSMSVFVNGGIVKKYPTLSMDPASAYFVERMVNDDDANDEVAVTSLLASNTAITSDKRPVNGAFALSAIAATVATFLPLKLKVLSSPGGANPTVAAGTTTDVMKYRDRLLITMTDATHYTVTSQEIAPSTIIATAQVIGALCTPVNPIFPPFTLTNGGTVLSTGDTLELSWHPFPVNQLVGGTIIPDVDNFPLTRFRIVANDHKTVTIGSGDMTSVGAIADRAVIVAPTPLGGNATTYGYDGLGAIADANFVSAMDVSATFFKDLIGQNKGLVKLGCPGKTATLVQKAGLALAEAMNYQFRVEVPSNITTEPSAIGQINNTVGRSDFGVVSFPSYGYVDDPLKPGQNKLIPLTGMIHGREALMAKTYDGYHKAAAGLEVTLPRVIKLPATNLNEEVLNPQGLNVVKKLKGNFVVWGDRSISLDPAWKFKHQREQMSHYENRLRESFDYIIFAINDPEIQPGLVTTLQSFFLPEWTKKALRGATPADAFSIALGDDINTNLTRANGDLNCNIRLRLADTVERFIIRIGKAGIFESLA